MSRTPLPNFEFTYADAEKSAEIASLVNSVYRGENSKKGWTTEAGILDGIRITDEKVCEIIKSPNNIIIAASLDSKIIACVHLEKKSSDCWLGMLSVDVNFQTFGLGKMMIEKCEIYARDIFKCSVMKMKVIGVRSELIEYYKRRGYNLTGDREEFGSAGDTFGDPKSDNLYFEILIKQLIP